MQINFRQAHQSNFARGRTQTIRFLVIHFTANNGDTAAGNANFFAGANRNASAHYFVDEREIWQTVRDEDTAWHSGAQRFNHPTARNQNSIGIEMVSRRDVEGRFFIREEVVTRTIELTEMLMSKYDIPVENVIRHFDVTGKNCPEPFVRNPQLWEDFRQRLNKNGELTMSQYKELSARLDGIDAKLKAFNTSVFNTLEETPEWARPIVKQMVNSGAISGDENGNLGLSWDLVRMLVINANQNRVFNTVDEMPDWAKGPIQKLLDRGFIKGDENGKLGLSRDLVRLLVINDNAGLYD